jgi:activating signal cointegrator complex subunit 2
MSILEHRSNVYDNDEFDIFNQENIDLTKIHRGKKFVNIFCIIIFTLCFSLYKSRTRDAAADLDDKSHLAGMSERYSRLGIVEDETDGEYDDEYDDTYDDGTVNVRDKDDTIDNELEKNENRFDIH